MTPTYQYNAEVIRIVDGDTVDLRCDVGFRMSMTDRFRLFGIDAYELHGPDKERGLKAKSRVEELLPVGSRCVVKTHKDAREKFGRFLAEIQVSDVELTINEMLVREGLAVPYFCGEG